MLIACEVSRANSDLAAATQLVIFEDLCADPAGTLSKLFDHCGFATDKAFVDKAAARIAAPTYYKSGFTDTELVSIARETGDTMERIRALAAG